jgi:hypothetical protein
MDGWNHIFCSFREWGSVCVSIWFCCVVTVPVNAKECAPTLTGMKNISDDSRSYILDAIIKKYPMHFIYSLHLLFVN